MGDIVLSSDVAEFLEGQHLGDELLVSCVSSLGNVVVNSLAFSKVPLDVSFTALAACTIICPLASSGSPIGYTQIKVANPRLAFAKAVAHFFGQTIEQGVDETSKTGEACEIDKTVSVGRNCTIGNHVHIGEGTVLQNNITISDRTIIGKFCYIKSGTVIGEDGFGFDFEPDGIPVRIPHVGGVVIGDHVEIGANNTIARGTIGNTVLEDHVKTDDQVHIAHNVTVGAKTIITACVEISGSVEIGEGCWFGPNASVIQKVKIGNAAVVGIGATVIESVADKQKVMGIQAYPLKKLVKIRRRLEGG